MQTASGFSVENPLELLLGFVNHAYPMYDGVEVAQDHKLRVVEIALSTMLNSRISGNTGGKIWLKRATVEASLSQIPSHIDLLDITPGEPIPAESAIEQAIDSMCEIPRCKLAVATKILHKKRPGLIPIFDSVVEGLYWKSRLITSTCKQADSWGKYAIGLTHLVRADLESVREKIQELREALEKNHTPLTGCGILNALMWAVLSGNDDWRRELA